MRSGFLSNPPSQVVVVMVTLSFVYKAHILALSIEVFRSNEARRTNLCGPSRRLAD